MPFANIKITKEGASSEQKAALIKGVTNLLADKLGKNLGLRCTFHALENSFARLAQPLQR